MLRRLALGLYLTTTITAVAAWADGSDECLQSKDHQLSIKACGELIAGKQATALIYNRRGEAYRGTQQLDLAIADHTKAIELAPDEPAGYNNRCATRTQAGDFDGAVADCDKAIHVNPSYVSAYFNRGIANERKGNYDQSIADHGKAIELNPKYARAYNARAWTFYKAGKAALGLADVEQALQLAPENGAALDTRAHILEAMGKKKEAIEDYRKALAADPSLTDSAEALKKARGQERRRHEAREGQVVRVKGNRHEAGRMPGKSPQMSMVPSTHEGTRHRP